MSVATTRPAEGAVFRGLLRGHRARRGWSQMRTAEECEIDHSMIARLEGGQRNPTRGICRSLAAGLRLSPDEADELTLAAGHLPADLPPDRLRRVLALVREATPDEAAAALALVRASHGR